MDPHTTRQPSVLWLWGLWVCTAFAVAAFVLALSAPAPLDRFLLGLAGVLLFAGGAHQRRVVDYKVATRGRYSTFGPDSYPLQRRTARSAMVLGVVFIASAIVGLPVR